MRIIISIGFVLTLLSNAIGQNFVGDQNEINDILKNIEKFSSYVMESDYKGIANSYTKDAKIFPNNSEIIEGRDLIQNYWELPEGVSIAYHKIHPKEIKIIGDEAYDYGLYKGKTRNVDGSEVSWKGKYVIVWKKGPEGWKIYLDIWNRIANKE